MEKRYSLIRRSRVIHFILTGAFSALIPVLQGWSEAQGQSHLPGQHTDKMVIPDKVPEKVLSFDLSAVKLLPSPFLENCRRDARWLLSLDNNRLLHTFRLNAGIASKAKPYEGWEAPDIELRGHITGHVLSGLALMYASTGEVAFKLKGDSLVSELKKVQDALDQNGYVSAFPQHFVNRAINGERVWAPWYTLHKLYAGLIDMYLSCNNLMAFEIVKKMGDWAWLKLSGLNQQQLDRMLKVEFGGMSEVMYNLYALTANDKYLKVAGMFYHREQLDPLADKKDVLKAHHANTYIPKIIGEARGYELSGEKKQQELTEFFWQTVIGHHTYATGGNSDNEFFFSPDSLSIHLSHRTTETCNTYNMLKLTQHLFTRTAEVAYADYFEQALYNHILGSQDPATGMVCYFMPLKPGTFKVYSTAEHSFWCCVGTGFENHAKYGEAIYFHDDRNLMVNLFIPSEISWKEKGIRLRQETQYPEKESTRLTILGAGSDKFAILLRYPSWAASGIVLKINGKSQSVKNKPGSYIRLERKWAEGDVIELKLPMSLRLIQANDAKDVAAVAFGPVVLAGVMGREGMKADSPYGEDQDDQSKVPIPESLKKVLNIGGKKLTELIKPANAETPLSFQMTDTQKEKVSFIPYYQIHDERYVVYWKLNQKF